VRVVSFQVAEAFTSQLRPYRKQMSSVRRGSCLVTVDPEVSSRRLRQVVSGVLLLPDAVAASWPVARWTETLARAGSLAPWRPGRIFSHTSR